MLSLIWVKKYFKFLIILMVSGLNSKGDFNLSLGKSNKNI